MPYFLLDLAYSQSTDSTWAEFTTATAFQMSVSVASSRASRLRCARNSKHATMRRSGRPIDNWLLTPSQLQRSYQGYSVVQVLGLQLLVLTSLIREGKQNEKGKKNPEGEKNRFFLWRSRLLLLHIMI